MPEADTCRNDTPPRREVRYDTWRAVCLGFSERTGSHRRKDGDRLA